ncbi:L-galactose dehydrogenase [Biscogniauxia sp. FL1348]|nr:L-galactose dehydrogenase [Biscogniauxia sp. FL1348]
MSSPPPRPPLHTVLPPLVLGTATFNTQYVSDPFALPAERIVKRALDLGVRAFDTSPYYGPSEAILGAALSHPSVARAYARSSYFLITKVGRVAGSEFDYTASWVRYSVYRSLERLVPAQGQGQKRKLDLVYLHDVEFVSPGEVLTAVRELMRLRDDEGVLSYVGISGYPVGVLCALAELVYRSTGTPLDAVLSYCHFSVQNTSLGDAAVLRRLAGDDARVDVVLNASMLGMGLLTTRGADAGPIAAWHPSPEGLRAAAHALAPVAEAAGEKLEVVAIRWALDNWARVGAVRGAVVGAGEKKKKKQRVGVSVMGISSVAELEETVSVFQSVMDGLLAPETDEDRDKQAKSLARRDKIQGLVEKMWEVLGQWKDYSWSSPEPGFVNTRKPSQMGVVPDDGIFEKHSPVWLKVEEVPAEEPAVQG